MERQQLLTTLQELRTELAGEEGVDAQILARLDQVIADLERNASQGGATTAAAAPPDSSGLKEMLLKFEAQHPQMSASIGRVADALAAMGF
jgi:hypothetical protein